MPTFAPSSSTPWSLKNPESQENQESPENPGLLRTIGIQEIRGISEVPNQRTTEIPNQGFFIDFGKDIAEIGAEYALNCTSIPEICEFKDMSAIASPDAPEDIYISPVGCYGIVRRKQERNLKINPRLEEILLSISSQMSLEEIEKRSRIQKRGRFSDPPTIQKTEKQDTAPDQDEPLAMENNTAQVVAFVSPSKTEDKRQTVSASSLEPVQLTLFDFLSQ